MSVVLREREVGERHRVQRFTAEDGEPLTKGAVLERWAADAGFVDVFTEALREAPYDAFFWETPPWWPGELDAPYEHCLTDAPALARVRPEPGPFREHFGEDPVATFDSLGGDATLVAPTESTGTFPHLATFVREAEQDHVRALFAALAAAVPGRLAPRCWVSTSGLGVHWLHLRVDERPKYYVHRPYR